MQLHCWDTCAAGTLRTVDQTSISGHSFHFNGGDVNHAVPKTIHLLFPSTRPDLRVATILSAT